MAFFDQENTKLLAEEGLLLQAIERKGVNQREMDRYVNRLSEIVNRKVWDGRGERGSVKLCVAFVYRGYVYEGRGCSMNGLYESNPY